MRRILTTFAIVFRKRHKILIAHSPTELPPRKRKTSVKTNNREVAPWRRLPRRLLEAVVSLVGVWWRSAPVF